MAATNQRQTALLTEHFRYTPLTLLDDIINNVNELIFRAVNAIEEGLNQQSPENLGFELSTNQYTSEEARKDALFDLKQNEIDSGIVQLESLLNATVDKDFDKFEIYTLRNILALGHEEEAEDLANWVQLEHYRNLDLSRTADAPTPEQVQLQRRKYQETAKLNTMLKQEEARNAVVLEQLSTLVRGDTGSGEAAESPFAFLTSSAHISRSSASQPLTENMQYALSQLPALRQLITQLKESLRSLPNARHTRQDDIDAPDSKRRQYLDSQSQRAMQRKGINADVSAKTAAITGGRKIGRDEVEGMEAVVQALGGARRMPDV